MAASHRSRRKGGKTGTCPIHATFFTTKVKGATTASIIEIDIVAELHALKQAVLRVTLETRFQQRTKGRSCNDLFR
jgi:hypothetical protein